MVVAVDVGISKRARDLAEKLGAPLAIVEKRRVTHQSSPQTLNVIGDVEGKTAVLFDDEIDSGSSIVNAAKALILRQHQSIQPPANKQSSKRIMNPQLCAFLKT